MSHQGYQGGWGGGPQQGGGPGSQDEWDEWGGHTYENADTRRAPHGPAAAGPGHTFPPSSPYSGPESVGGKGQGGGNGKLVAAILGGAGAAAVAVGLIAYAVLGTGAGTVPGPAPGPTPGALPVTSDVEAAPAWTAPAGAEAPGVEAVPDRAEASTGAGTDTDTDTESGVGSSQDLSSIAPASGTYSGNVSQRGTRRTDIDYPVEMSFSSTGSTVNYPTLNCSGTLTPLGNRDGARMYRETITAGTCDPTGTWYVMRGSDTALAAEYRPSRNNYVVVGHLTR